MFNHNLFYELIIILYACSVLFYFVDFLQHNRKANRLAFWLLSIVWISQTALLTVKMIEQEHLPLFSRFDTLFFFAWLLITFSLLINWFFRMDLFLFFTNVVGFTVMALSLFVAGRGIPEEMAQQLSSEWLTIHISMAFLSYAAFTLSFIFSVLYLFQHKLLKRKKWSKQFLRGPSLAQLDKISFYLNLIGFPVLLLSLILGIVWAINTVEAAFWFDTKVVFSLFVLLMYGIYLYQRVVRGWSGKKIVELNCVCFFVLLTNYFISSLFSRFHIWS
ncbi:cytochrome C assembly family protein [Caldalkalibacillus salinus]|uniref:cytochrome C assembly family protein n=1 Tax=Caldalkalibacillus salinus TaxID=2803787 RepID=UPI001922015B|nr:cytochrome c biogenesis protein [Caldalkalibacillus salinus]